MKPRRRPKLPPLPAKPLFFVHKLATIDGYFIVWRADYDAKNPVYTDVGVCRDEAEVQKFYPGSRLVESLF